MIGCLVGKNMQFEEAFMIEAGQRAKQLGELVDYPIRIDRDGIWYHDGRPINRSALITLFSRCLRRDESGAYWLVTPAEAGRILVEDVPFQAVEMAVRGTGEDQEVSFRTNLDVWVTAGPDHPVRVSENAATGEPRPYIVVQDRLEARITRSVFYQMVACSVRRRHNGEDKLGLWSQRTFIPLGSWPTE